jgi:transcriptional regulator with XRE-family HTH domain
LTAWRLAPDLGERLRELRVLLDWTQEQLAREMGRNKQQASMWETGKARPARRGLEELAARYGWPLEMFADGGRRPGEILGAAPSVAAAPATDWLWDEGVVGMQRALDLMGEIEALAARALPGLSPEARQTLRLSVLDALVLQAKQAGREPPAWVYRLAFDLTRRGPATTERVSLADQAAALVESLPPSLAPGSPAAPARAPRRVAGQGET